MTYVVSLESMGAKVSGTPSAKVSGTHTTDTFGRFESMRELGPGSSPLIPTTSRAKSEVASNKALRTT